MKKPIQAVFMFLWLPLDWVSRGENVEQRPSTLRVLEGDSSVINCSYSDSASSYFPWYKQEPGKGPQLIIDIRENRDKNHNQRLTVFLDKTEKLFSLHIAATQPGDAAVYFCAASAGNDGWGKLNFGAGTQVVVTPDIKNPDPSVYQLRKHKVNNASVCLFTDFDSQVNVSQSTDNEAFKSGTTVLDMRSTHSKSNGALAWSTDANFECKDAFDEQDFFPNSGIPCDAKSEEKSFETDMNLNLQNLSVIGLRILFLKVAGFNLLMTLRLWSS